jgi:hypothetical protein
VNEPVVNLPLSLTYAKAESVMVLMETSPAMPIPVLPWPSDFLFSPGLSGSGSSVGAPSLSPAQARLAQRLSGWRHRPAVGRGFAGRPWFGRPLREDINVLPDVASRTTLPETLTVPSGSLAVVITFRCLDGRKGVREATVAEYQGDGPVISAEFQPERSIGAVLILCNSKSGILL